MRGRFAARMNSAVRARFLPNVPHAYSPRLAVSDNQPRKFSRRDVSDFGYAAFITTPELTVSEYFVLHFNNNRHVIPPGVAP